MISVSRAYEMKRRAERRDETRQRIVDAAIELHETVGPAATTISDIADHAGVGRVTVYRHFPDEAAMLRACSGHYYEQHPLPDSASWRRIADPEERLRIALRETYAYYGATEKMHTLALRDRGDDPVMAPWHEHWDQAANVLAAGWGARGRRRKLLRAAITLALSFDTWRTLTRDQRLDEDQAVELATAIAAL